MKLIRDFFLSHFRAAKEQKKAKATDKKQKVAPKSKSKPAQKQQKAAPRVGGKR